MPALPASQDLPPKGGFPSITYQRHLPMRGLPTWGIFAAFAAFTTFGCYKYLKATDVIRELEREKLQSRLALVPLLMAEMDYDRCRRLFANEKIEKAVNAGDWRKDRSVYRTNSEHAYIPRSIVASDKGQTEQMPFHYNIYISEDGRPLTIELI